jgi:hypothetical protein
VESWFSRCKKASSAMKKAGIFVLTAACAAVSFSLPAAAGAANQSTGDQAAEALLPPVEKDKGYRPPWADPDAKPPEPGIENDPVPFNPADVDSKSDGLNNNL